MSERNAPRVYGLRVGLVSGLFSIAQVAISVAAAHGSEAQLRAMQLALAILSSGGIADPTVLIRPLVPMLAVTYLSMIGIGLLTLWFAAQAGRLAAIDQGRHAGGATAGMWVWLVSTLVWMVASVVATVVTNSDGTISGVFTGTFTSSLLPQELLYLLLQEIAAALVSLGFCAMAGARGARYAPMIAPNALPTGMTTPTGFPPPGMYPHAPYGPYPMPGYPMYPAYPPQPGYPPQQAQQPYPGYPGYPGYPAGPWGPPPTQMPQPAPQPAPQPTSQPPTDQMRRMSMAGPLPYPPPPSFYAPQEAPTASGDAPAGPASPVTPQPE